MLGGKGEVGVGESRSVNTLQKNHRVGVGIPLFVSVSVDEDETVSAVGRHHNALRDIVRALEERSRVVRGNREGRGLSRALYRHGIGVAKSRYLTLEAKVREVKHIAVSGSSRKRDHVVKRVSRGVALSGQLDGITLGRACRQINLVRTSAPDNGVRNRTGGNRIIGGATGEVDTSSLEVPTTVSALTVKGGISILATSDDTVTVRNADTLNLDADNMAERLLSIRKRPMSSRR